MTSSGESIQPTDPDEDSVETIYGGSEIDRPKEEIDELVARYIGDVDTYENEIPFEDLKEVIGFWRAFRVGGAEEATEENAQEVYNGLLRDPFLVQDYTLYLSTRKRRLNHSYIERPTIAEIRAYTKATVHPQTVRPSFVDQVIPNLTKLGFERPKAYELAVTGASKNKERVARLTRFVGWLAGEKYMQDLPKKISTAKLFGRVSLRQIATLSVLELKDQIDAHRQEIDRVYNMSIPTEAQAYKKIEDSLLGAHAVAEILILGDVTVNQ